MAEINLTQYGITGTTEIVHNPSYELLYEEETKADLTGYEKGQESELGAVNVRQVYIQVVLLKISTSLWMRTLKTLYGGLLMSMLMTIIHFLRRIGQF